MNEHETVSEELRFFTKLRGFIRYVDLIVTELFTKQKTSFNPNKIKLAEQTIEKTSKDHIIQGFISSSEKFWKMINERNEEFLIKNIDSIFESNFIKQEIQPVKQIFIDGLVTNDEKDTIWKFLEDFIVISINYLHRMRVGVIDGGNQIYLTKFSETEDSDRSNILDSIDIASHAKLRNIQLVFENMDDA